MKYASISFGVPEPAPPSTQVTTSALTSRAGGTLADCVAGEDYAESLAAEGGGEAEDKVGGLVELGFEFGEWEGEEVICFRSWGRCVQGARWVTGGWGGGDVFYGVHIGECLLR